MYTRGECGQDRLGGLNVKAFIDQVCDAWCHRYVMRGAIGMWYVWCVVRGAICVLCDDIGGVCA